MDPRDTDFSFMRSGSRGAETYTDTTHLRAVLAVFARNATETAFGYVAHSRRNGVTPEDLQAALKLEVFEFLKRRHLGAQVSAATSEARRGDAPDADPLFLSELEIDPFRQSACACDPCQKVNLVLEKWDAWRPATPFEKILKKNIDNLPVETPPRQRG